MKCWCDGNCGGESSLLQAVISSDLMSYAAGRLEELHDQASRTQDGAMVVFCQALLESGLKVEVIELKYFLVLWTFDQREINADLNAHYLPLVHSTWLFVHQRSVFTCKTQSSGYSHSFGVILQFHSTRKGQVFVFELSEVFFCIFCRCSERNSITHRLPKRTQTFWTPGSEGNVHAIPRRWSTLLSLVALGYSFFLTLVCIFIGRNGL